MKKKLRHNSTLSGNITRFVLLATLICVAAQARDDSIDNFAVGPQSHSLGPGDSYWNNPVTGLDPAQVLGAGGV
jgi:hypothetical protein